MTEQVRARAQEVSDEFCADEAANGHDTAVAHIAMALAQAEARIPLDEAAGSAGAERCTECDTAERVHGITDHPFAAGFTERCPQTAGRCEKEAGHEGDHYTSYRDGVWAAVSAGAETEPIFVGFDPGRPGGDETVEIPVERAQGAPPQALDGDLAKAIAALPDDEWALMIGHEKYDPIPGSPGDVNHPGLAGQMIWWASTRRSDPEPNVPLIIVSAERHPSPGAALRDLAGQMRRRYPALRPSDERAESRASEATD